jgi:hypothetical protein
VVRGELDTSMSSSNQTVMVSSQEEQGNRVTEEEEEEKDESAPITPFNASSAAETVPSLMEEAMAECMSEKRSETSSSKSFEVVANCPTPPNASEVTSGDELETTTTSSDIEVISSPTPSSTTTSSRLSSTSGFRDRGFTVRHARTGSEISQSGSGSSEDVASSPIEIDRLVKKLAELSEMLEARESKVLELSNTNFELVEKNTDLSSQVREAMKINAKLNETVISTEDITQRFSSMERKLQKSMAEKDALTAENKVRKCMLSCVFFNRLIKTEFLFQEIENGILFANVPVRIN